MKRAFAACCPVAVLPRCLVDNKRCSRTILINCAQRSCVPLHTTACIGRTIKWVHDDHDAVYAEFTRMFALFRQHGASRFVQYGKRCIISRNIYRILRVSNPRQPPIGVATEHYRNCISNLIQHCKNLGVRA